MRFLDSILLAFATTALTANLSAFEVGPQIAGYGRDGTRVYPDFTPPTTTLKQRWVTELPSWGQSQPIAIGDRIYVTVEPLESRRLFPSLLCLDAASGRILWDKPLDHLSAVPASVKDAALAAWKDVMADYAKRHEFYLDYMKTKDDKAMVAAGYEWNARWNKVIPKDGKPIEAKCNIAKQAGFTLETWRHGCSGGNATGIGAAYATPVSDGKHLWTSTAWGGFFCHDLEGKEEWVAFSPGAEGEYCRNGRSPILWKNLLLSDITEMARAFDAATGKLLWSHPGDKSQMVTVVSPMVLTSGGKDIFWSAGPRAYLLPEGTPVPIDGWKDGGMQTLVKSDERDVIFFCGASEHSGWSNKGKGSTFEPPAAVRFAFTAGTLTATVLWHGKTAGGGSPDFSGGNKPWMVYYDKMFYHINGAILDAATGTVRAGKISRGKGGGGKGPDSATPPSNYMLLIANNHVYGLTSHGDLSVFTTAGKPVSSLKISEPEATYEYGQPGGKKEARICVNDGPVFSLAKDLVIVRSLNHLHGIGN